MKVSNGKTKKYGVYSDDQKMNLLFESDSATDAIQWAINGGESPIKLEGTFDLSESGSQIIGKYTFTEKGSV